MSRVRLPVWYMRKIFKFWGPLWPKHVPMPHFMTKEDIQEMLVNISFTPWKGLSFSCNSTSIFALQAISRTTNNDPQDIKVEFANLMPYPFKQAVVSAAVTSCCQFLPEDHFSKFVQKLAKNSNICGTGANLWPISTMTIDIERRQGYGRNVLKRISELILLGLLKSNRNEFDKNINTFSEDL